MQGSDEARHTAKAEANLFNHFGKWNCVVEMQHVETSAVHDADHLPREVAEGSMGPLRLQPAGGRNSVMAGEADEPHSGSEGRDAHGVSPGEQKHAMVTAAELVGEVDRDTCAPAETGMADQPDRQSDGVSPPSPPNASRVYE